MSKSPLRQNHHVLGLLVAEGQVVAAQTEFDRIAQWCPPDDLDAGAVAEAHFKQPATQLRVFTTHMHHAAAAPDFQVAETARLDTQRGPLRGYPRWQPLTSSRSQ